jgi:hypothetical protein
MNASSKFGPFIYEDEQWIAIIELEGHNPIEVRLYVNPLEFVDWAEKVEKLFWDQIQDEVGLRQKICTFMLELALEWFQDDDTPERVLTLEEFVDLIDIESVDFYEDGSSSWWYSDGDVFAGHSISADLNAEGVFEDAQING